LILQGKRHFSLVTLGSKPDEIFRRYSRRGWCPGKTYRVCRDPLAPRQRQCDDGGLGNWLNLDREVENLPMTSLQRLFCFLLILTAVILFQSPGSARGQSSDPKSKGTGSISGRVTMGGKNAANIVIAAFGGDRGNRRPAAQATTDSEGRYHLYGLPAAQYQVAPMTANLVNTEQTTGVNPYFGSGKAVFLSVAESVEDIDLKLVRGGVVTGRVSNADGKPVIEERINLQLVDANGNLSTPAAGYYPANYQMYQTDDRGVYRIYGLPAGRYKVSVGIDPADGVGPSNGRTVYRQTFYPDVTDTAKATIVEISEGSESENIDIKVGRSAETYGVAGRVVDSETEKPIAGIRPTYALLPKNQDDPGNNFGGLPTNSRGEFRIEGLSPGRYRIFASSQFEGGTHYSDPIIFELVDRDVTNLELKAVQGLGLSGVIMADAETNSSAMTKFAGLRITASVRSESQPQTYTGGWSQVAADGTFQINGLRPGKAGLFLYFPANPNDRGFVITRVEHNGVDVTRTLEIQAGQSLSDVRVFVGYGTGVIRGTVKYENGTLPSGTRVFVRARREGASSPNGSGALVDSRGHFVISNLAPGTYEVTVDVSFSSAPPTGQRPQPTLKQFVTVADGTESEMVFTLEFKPTK
jgi:protocatechuate 3,4-dioxygenase beta subunit